MIAAGYLLAYLLGVASVFLAARTRFFLAENTARMNAARRARSVVPLRATLPAELDSGELAAAIRRRGLN